MAEVLKFTEDHLWVRVEGNHAHLGISEYGQVELGEVIAVELPDVGDEVEKGEPFGEIESVRTVSELLAPRARSINKRCRRIVSVCSCSNAACCCPKADCCCTSSCTSVARSYGLCTRVRLAPDPPGGRERWRAHAGGRRPRIGQ